MRKITQISESIRLGALLAISGGMMDPVRCRFYPFAAQSAGKQPDFSCLRHSGRKFSKDSRTRHRHDNVYRKPSKCHTEYV